MAECVLSSKTRQQQQCFGRNDYLSDYNRVVVQTRAAADGLTVSSTHTHICLFHYNKYLHNWKADGCIDPECCLLHDTQVECRALVECPQRILSVLNSIYKLPIELPIGSLIHYQCRDTFDERYKCRDGYQPPKKRQRVRHCPSQQKCDDKVCMYSNVVVA
jgi:hypothetical protein